MKEQCENFGNLDGMVGSCVDCKYDRPELWKKCWDKKRKDIAQKLEGIGRKE